MFWDRVAGIYDIFVNVINGKTHKELRQIISNLIQAEDSVLECACGTGLLSTVIASNCKTLTATDFSSKMLKRAEKNCAAFTNVTFRQADILSLDFPDNAFDTVVAGNVIHLLDEPLKALDELNRVCKPGRMLIICVNHIDFFDAFSIIYRETMMKALPRQGDARKHRSSTCKALL